MDTTTVPELEQFQKHVELYEFLMEKMQKRTRESIMPAVRDLQEQIEESNRLIKNQLLPRAKSVELISAEPNNYWMDLLMWLGVGFFIGGAVYLSYRTKLFRV